jgi:hypothetical protein
MNDATDEAKRFMDELLRVHDYFELCNREAGRDQAQAQYDFLGVLGAIGDNPLMTDGVMDVVAAKASYLFAFTSGELDPEPAHIDEHLGEGVAAIWGAIPEADVTDDLSQYVLNLSALDRRTLWAAACCNLANLKVVLQLIQEHGVPAGLAKFGIEPGRLLGFLGPYQGTLQHQLWDNTICGATDEVSQQIRALVLP